MSGPANINPRALVKPLDEMLTAGGQGWDALEALFRPALLGDPWRPDDRLLKEIGALSRTEFGKRLFDWLFALTLDAPYPTAGQSIEMAALAAAKHESRAAVGEVIRKAIIEGRRLIDEKGAEQ